jgi:hypothetical protein
MRGGVRLPALIVAVGLVGAGCSDPAGAARKEQAAARKKSPSPRPAASRPPATQRPKAAVWWQAAGTTKTSNGLRVKIGVLHGGRVRIAVTDVGGHASRTIIASATPQTATIGRFTLSAIKVSKSRKYLKYGVGFHYGRR